MKLTHILSIAALAVAPLAYGQSGGMSGMNHGHEPATGTHGAEKGHAEGHSAKGTIKSVNASKGTVTIAHGAVETLKWPAMKMTFKAKDKEMLEQAKPGKEVQFQFEQRGKDYVITSMKPAFGSCSDDCGKK